MDDTVPNRQQEIARLTKHRSTLTLPGDQVYHSLYTEHIEGLKAAILEDRPLDERIKGLEASLSRKGEKLSSISLEIQAAQTAYSTLDRDIAAKKILLAELKQKRMSELNIEASSPDGAGAAGPAQHQIQQLMAQVNLLQAQLNQLAPHAPPNLQPPQQHTPQQLQPLSQQQLLHQQQLHQQQQQQQLLHQQLQQQQHQQQKELHQQQLHQQQQQLQQQQLLQQQNLNAAPATPQPGAKPAGPLLDPMSPSLPMATQEYAALAAAHGLAPQAAIPPPSPPPAPPAGGLSPSLPGSLSPSPLVVGDSPERTKAISVIEGIMATKKRGDASRSPRRTTEEIVNESGSDSEPSEHSPPR